MMMKKRGHQCQPVPSSNTSRAHGDHLMIRAFPTRRNTRAPPPQHVRTHHRQPDITSWTGRLELQRIELSLNPNGVPRMATTPRMPPTDGDDSRQNSASTSGDVGNGVLQQPASPPPASVSLPRIEPEPPEPPDTIHVAAGGKLTVPREDIFDDFD